MPSLQRTVWKPFQRVGQAGIVPRTRKAYPADLDHFEAWAELFSN